MKFLPLFSSFIKGYELTLMLGFIILLILLILGALLIYSGRIRINRNNIFVLITYRLIQIFFFIEMISLLAMMIVQIFSIKTYHVDKKTGAYYGLVIAADGYSVPMVISDYQMPKHLVSANTKHNAELRVVTPDHYRTEVSIRSEDSWKNFMFSLFTYLKIISLLLVSFFLLKILFSFRKGKLFGERHFGYVSYIGITLMLYQVLRLILAFICNPWIIGGIYVAESSGMTTHKSNSYVSMNIDHHFNFLLFITGFLIILLAQVFKRGFDLQKEQDLTV